MHSRGRCDHIISIAIMSGAFGCWLIDKRRSCMRNRAGRGMKWGRRVMGIARGRRRGRKFVNFAITAVLAFNRRGSSSEEAAP